MKLSNNRWTWVHRNLSKKCQISFLPLAHRHFHNLIWIHVHFLLKKSLCCFATHLNIFVNLPFISMFVSIDSILFVLYFVFCRFFLKWLLSLIRKFTGSIHFDRLDIYFHFHSFYLIVSRSVWYSKISWKL